MDLEKRSLDPNAPRNIHFKEPRSARSGRMFAGVIILTIGTLFLLEKMGIIIPSWLISWPMLLIVSGLYLGYKHSFRGVLWVIVTLLGAFFMFDRIMPDIDFGEYIFPVILIAVGLVIMLRPRSRHMEPLASWDSPAPGDTTATPPGENDVIDSVTIFGGVKKKIISKTFRGGELTTILGGTELDLTKADVNGRIELELTQILGGTKLVVPPHWRIHSDDLVCIFGGLDDKRVLTADVASDQSKVLVLRGTCILGGIDIKSY
jgi:predicted membrane protein